MDCCGLSQTIVDDCGQLQTIVNDCGLPWTEDRVLDNLFMD